MKYASFIFIIFVMFFFFCSCGVAETDIEIESEQLDFNKTPVTADDVWVEVFGYKKDESGNGILKITAVNGRMEITVLNRKLVAKCDGYCFKEQEPRIYIDDITGDGIDDVAIVIASSKKDSEHIYIIDCKDGERGVFESAGEGECDFRTVGKSETIFINTPADPYEAPDDNVKLGLERDIRYDVVDGKIISSKVVTPNYSYVWGTDSRTIAYRNGTLTVESKDYNKLADRIEVLALKDEKTGNIVSFEVGVFATWARESTDPFDIIFKEIIEEGNTRRNAGYAFRAKEIYGVPQDFVFDSNVYKITNDGVKNPGLVPADNCIIKSGKTDSGLDYCIYYEKHDEGMGRGKTFEERKAGETTAYAFVRVSEKNVVFLEYILDESTLDLAEQSVKRISLISETKEWTNYRVYDTVVMRDESFTVDSYRMGDLVIERADAEQVTFNVGIADKRNYSYCINGVYRVTSDFVLDSSVTDVVPLPFLGIDGTEKLFRNVTSDGREYYMTHHLYEYLRSDGTHRDFVSCVYIMLSDEYLLQVTYISPVDDFYAIEKSIERIAFVSAEKSEAERIPESLPSADEVYAALLEARALYPNIIDVKNMNKDQNDRIVAYSTEYALALDYGSADEFKNRIHSVFAKEAEEKIISRCFEYYSDMHSAIIPLCVDQDGKLYVIDDYYYFKDHLSSSDDEPSQIAGVFVDYESDEKLIISVIKNGWKESCGGKDAIKAYDINEYSYEYIDGAWRFTDYKHW